MKDHTTYDVGNPGPIGIGAMMYSYLWWKMSDAHQTLHFRSNNANIKKRCRYAYATCGAGTA